MSASAHRLRRKKMKAKVKDTKEAEVVEAEVIEAEVIEAEVVEAEVVEQIEIEDAAAEIIAGSDPDLDEDSVDEVEFELETEDDELTTRAKEKAVELGLDADLYVMAIVSGDEAFEKYVIERYGINIDRRKKVETIIKDIMASDAYLSAE